ncbi:MAG: propionyl-coenzyme A carboxylase alpha polypeptide [Mesorhizobium sp.]|nr:MAG: propionyl-coenzyme A carboxylase alpha polypeptide [Mesorhizobium sp.]
MSRSSSFAPPSVLPDISPTRREIGCRNGFRQFQRLRKGRAMKPPISPQVGEMPGRAEGSAVPQILKIALPA